MLRLQPLAAVLDRNDALQLITTQRRPGVALGIGTRPGRCALVVCNHRAPTRATTRSALRVTQRVLGLDSQRIVFRQYGPPNGHRLAKKWHRLVVSLETGQRHAQPDQAPGEMWMRLGQRCSPVVL